jgi:ATP-dependent helicase/nuclease subunit B
VRHARIVHSPDISLVLDIAARWVQPFLDRSEVLIVAATRAAGDEFARMAAPAGAFGLHRMTVMQAAAAVAARAMAEAGIAPATRLAMEAIAARVAFTLHKRSQLEYFDPVVSSPGFAAALAATIDDLRMARAPAAEIARGGGARLADLARMLRLYERELEDRKLVDAAGLLDIAAKAARDDSHPLAGAPLLLLDAPLEEQAALEFIAALASRASSVLAALGAVDAQRLATFESVLLAKAEAVAVPAPAHALDRVRVQLFSIERAPLSTGDASVSLFASPGESLECVEIARRIQALAGQGIPFDSIAVLLRDPDRYQPLMEEALRRAGIPIYCSRGVLRPDPAGRAFLALLTCAAEGCSASRFAEYLSLGQAPEVDASGAPPAAEPQWVEAEDEMLPAVQAAAEDKPEGAASTIPTPIAWERLLVDAAVIGGRDRWQRRLRGLESEFQKQLAAVPRDDQDERRRVERQLGRLSHLERFALPLIEDLSALPREANWGEWIEALRRLAARALRRPEAVLSMLEELRPMSEIGPVELAEVIGALSRRLRFLRREPQHGRYGSVFVGSIDEARGRAFDAVFTPGLAEGLFPRRIFEDPLLLDEHRGALTPRLRTRPDRTAAERLLLQTAVACARTRFIASYPSMDVAQGRPRVPSLYALELNRAVEGVVPNLRAFESRLTAAGETRLSRPAPVDPRRAIDDAEYDLAWLNANRKRPGSCSYLVEVNTNLARSLRTRWERWERPWRAADGLVLLGPRGAKLLGERRLGAHPYSASALQHFASCPYRFALYGIFGLRKRDEPAPLEQMDPLTRGAFFHEAQFLFFEAWRRRPSNDGAELERRMDGIVEQVAAEYAERLAPAIPRVWLAEIEDIRTELRSWLQLFVRDLAEWEPLHFELAFGLINSDSGGHDPASRQAPVRLFDSVLARGSIDLVERHRSRGALRITDHKTGKAPEREPHCIAGGAVLQPALYALAAEALTGQTAECGRLFYCTHRGNYAEIEVQITDRNRAILARALDIIDDAIGRTFLPAAPARDACALCDYRPVCGPYEEARAGLWKDQRALEPLNALRSLP